MTTEDKSFETVQCSTCQGAIRCTQRNLGNGTFHRRWFDQEKNEYFPCEAYTCTKCTVAMTKSHPGLNAIYCPACVDKGIRSDVARQVKEMSGTELYELFQTLSSRGEPSE